MQGGGHKGKSKSSIRASQAANKTKNKSSTGYGGHLRAVQGYKMTRAAANV
jgi:predicted NUDIX family phosphoesterase